MAKKRPRNAELRAMREAAKKSTTSKIETIEGAAKKKPKLGSVSNIIRDSE